MTITNGYTTRDSIQYLINENGLDENAADNAIIDDLITAVSRHIDNETRRRFFSTTADETRTYQAKSASRLHTDDIISITTLKTDDNQDRVYEVTWAATDYDLLPENAAVDGEPYTYIEVTPNGRYTFPGQRKGVEIVGKFGFASTAPADIKRACEMIVMSLYQSRRGVGVEGVAQVTGAGVVITPKDIPPMAAKIIAMRTRYWG